MHVPFNSYLFNFFHNIQTLGLQYFINSEFIQYINILSFSEVLITLPMTIQNLANIEFINPNKFLEYIKIRLDNTINFLIPNSYYKPQKKTNFIQNKIL